MNRFLQEKEQKVVIVGVGLIGGSFALAFRKYTDMEVYGIDRSSEVLKRACACGALTAAGTEDTLREAALILLCLYPGDTMRFMEACAGVISKQAVVVDTCGVKTGICEKAERLAAAHGFLFAGGHPMAGKETAGFASADGRLFKGASFIFTPVSIQSRSAAEALSPLFRRLGFGSVVITTPEEHDRRIAYTSQLPHVIANAYIKSSSSLLFSGFSAGSFRDVSRVAEVNEALWSQLFIENRTFLCSEIDGMIEKMKELRGAIWESDAERLRKLLKEGSVIKAEIRRIEESGKSE